MTGVQTCALPIYCYNKETEKLVLAKKLEKEIETIHESLSNDLEFDE